MNSLIRSGKLGPGCLRFSPAVLQRSYHVGKASSVNTAIEKGLRKSKGIGFRGKAKIPENDPREKYRERQGFPAYAHPPRPPTHFSSATGHESKFGTQSHAGRSAYGDKPSFKPKDSLNKGEWSRRGSTTRPTGSYPRDRDSDRPARRSDFEDESSDSRREGSDRLSSFSRRSRDPPEPRLTERANFGGERKDNRRDHSDGPSLSRESRDRPSSRPAGRDFGGERKDSRREDSHRPRSFGRDQPGRDQPGRTTYPSLTFGKGAEEGRKPVNGHVKFSDHVPSTPDRTFDRGSETPPDRRSTFRDRPSTGQTRSDYSDAPRFEPKSNFSERGTPGMGSQGRPYAPSYQQRDPAERGSQGHSFQPSSDRIGKQDDRSSSSPSEVVGKILMRRSEDSIAPTAATRFTKTFDSRLPISIPYTTPASEFLYGTSVVEAAISSRRIPKRKLYKLYIYRGENREDPERDIRLERLAQRNGVDVVHVGNDWLRLMDKMSAGRPHNGYILEASPLPRLPVTHLKQFNADQDAGIIEVAVDHQSREEAVINGTSSSIGIPRGRSGRKPMVLLLDSIVDPGNLGGIIRTASFLGVSAIAISTRNTASFTPVVLKASAGASENITLFSVNKPAGFIVDSKAAGWKVFAAVAPSKRDDPAMPVSLSTDELLDPLLEDPCILMLGNEGEGLRWNLRSKADVDLYIKGSGQSHNVDSLNVSVATGILLNSFLRQSKALQPTVISDTKSEGSAPLTGELF